ncbi:MAG: hypothetical protein KDN19_11600 [Verrucomicrobiae bacterium]|nr:hypothetical protein [Verrucomicrobiae bacterium]
MDPTTTHVGVQFDSQKDVLAGLAQDPIHAIYNALWEIKLDMSEIDTTTDADDSNTFLEAFNDLSAAEQSLVVLLTGNPNGTNGDSAATSGNFDGNYLQETNNQGYYDDKSFAALFDRVINGPRDQLGSEDTLTINETLDHDAGPHNTIGATDGVPGEDTNANNILDHDVIPEMSVYEKEAILAVLSASGDGGQAQSSQGGVSGNIVVDARAGDLTDADRGVIVSSTDGGNIAGDGVAHIGHRQDLIRAIGGDAGQAGDGGLDNSNGIGGDGGDVVISQGAFSGDIRLDSDHMITVEAADEGDNAAFGHAFVGHRQQIGTENEQDHLGGTNSNGRNRDDSVAVVVAGDGGREGGNVEQNDAQNGNGGNITISQSGGTGDITLSAPNDHLGDGGSPDQTSILISARDTGSGSGEFEVHIGHDIHIDSALAGDAASSVPHSIPASGGLGRNGSPDNTPVAGSDSERGLVGVLEGNGGDVTISQGSISDADISITGRDDVVVETTTTLGGDSRALIGHERTAGEDWSGNGDDDDVDDLSGTIESRSYLGDRRLIQAGHGADAVPDVIDVTYGEDVNHNGVLDPGEDTNGDGVLDFGGESLTDGDADGGNISITMGTTSANIAITSLTGDVDITSQVSNGGDADTEIGHEVTVAAVAGEAGVHGGGLNTGTAGDSGNINVSRGAIQGDISVTALDQDPGSKTDQPGDHREVVIGSTVANGGNPSVQIGHAEFYDLETLRSGYGGEYTVDYNSILDDFIEGFTQIPGTFTTPSADDYVAALGETIANPDAFISQFGTIDGLGNLVIEGRDPNAANLATAEDVVDAIEQIANSIRQALRYPEKMSESSRRDLILALVQAEEALETANTAKSRAYSSDTVGANAMISQQTFLVALRDAAISAEDAQNNAVDAVQGSLPDGNDLITDHADAGDIFYSGTGTVSGNVTVQSGRDVADGINPQDGVLDNDEFDFGVVSIYSEGAPGGNAETEIGHRRVAKNLSGIGAGEWNGSPDDGGTAGNGGDISIANTTTGTVTTRANTTRIRAEGIAETEVHLSHDLRIVNVAGMSETGASSRIGEGGDVASVQSSTGNVAINTEYLTSTLDGPNVGAAAPDSILGADATNSSVHLGVYAENLNHSDSDPQPGPSAPATGSPFSNTGGNLNVAQVTGGDLAFNLDILGNGDFHDLTFESNGIGQTGFRAGHVAEQSATSGEVAATNGHALTDARNVSADGSGRDTNPTENDRVAGHGELTEDDGGAIRADQSVSGDISFSQVEDLRVISEGTGDNDTFLGHDAENYAQSGFENDGADGVEDGGVVTANQFVTGSIALTASRTIEIGAQANNPGEVQVGHEGAQIAKSANDSELRTTDGDSTTTPNPVDVDADQYVGAPISLTAGEIIIENNGTGRTQVGHETYQEALTDTGGHVIADSYLGDNPTTAGVNEGLITMTTVDPTSVPGESDTAVTTGVNGDIFVDDLGPASETQVGHRSESRLVDGLLIASGSATATQTIDSDITVTAYRDLLVTDNSGGVAQIGHYIDELGNLDMTPLEAPLAAVYPVGHPNAGENVPYDAADTTEDEATTLPDASSAKQLGSGDITVTTGNNLVLLESGGRSEIGHRSPDSNADQEDVTVQALSGDIVVFVGTDNDSSTGGDTGSIDGLAPGDTASGGNDDLLIDGSAGGTARIGHNHADGTAPGTPGENVTQVSSGDIFVRVFGDMHVLGDGPNNDGIGHEHYDFDGSPTASVSDGNATPGSLTRNRISGETSLAAGQNNPREDRVLLADVMLFDNVGINSGYRDATFDAAAFDNVDINTGDFDASEDSVRRPSGNELRFNIPAQQNLTTATDFRFNDSHLPPLDDTGHTAVNPALRSGLADPIFIVDPITGAMAAGPLGANENYFSLQTNNPATAFSQAYFNTPGNFAFYFGKPAIKAAATGGGRRQVQERRPRIEEEILPPPPVDIDFIYPFEPFSQGVYHPGYFDVRLGEYDAVDSSADGSGILPDALGAGADHEYVLGEEESLASSAFFGPLHIFGDLLGIGWTPFPNLDAKRVDLPFLDFNWGTTGADGHKAFWWRCDNPLDFNNPPCVFGGIPSPWAEETDEVEWDYDLHHIR